MVEIVSAPKVTVDFSHPVGIDVLDPSGAEPAFATGDLKGVLAHERHGARDPRSFKATIKGEGTDKDFIEEKIEKISGSASNKTPFLVSVTTLVPFVRTAKQAKWGGPARFEHFSSLCDGAALRVWDKICSKADYATEDKRTEEAFGKALKEWLNEYFQSPSLGDNFFATLKAGDYKKPIWLDTSQPRSGWTSSSS